MSDEELREKLEALRDISGAFGGRRDSHATDRLLVEAILWLDKRLTVLESDPKRGEKPDDYDPLMIEGMDYPERGE